MYDIHWAIAWTGLVRFPNPHALALPRASESENLTRSLWPMATGQASSDVSGTYGAQTGTSLTGFLTKIAFSQNLSGEQAGPFHPPEDQVDTSESLSLYPTQPG